MDKPQERDDNQLLFVGRLSYRNVIESTEELLGFSGLEVQDGRLDSVSTNQKCPAWALDDGEFKQRMCSFLLAI